jgi:hypothetical protein
MGIRDEAGSLLGAPGGKGAVMTGRIDQLPAGPDGPGR